LSDDALDEEDPKFTKCEEKDSMIMSWLWNSMVSEISDICMFLNSAMKIWSIGGILQS